MAFTVEKLNTGNTLYDEIQELDVELSKLDSLRAIWVADPEDDRYTTLIIFRSQESGRDIEEVKVEASDDRATSMISALDTVRAQLQSERDTKWTEFQALDQP